MQSIWNLLTGAKQSHTRLPLAREPKPLPDVDVLRKALSDPKGLLLPEGETLEAYLDARWDRAWNIDTIETPSAICIAQNEKDVQAVVSFAAARVGKFRLGVACGRHSSVCMKDDCLVLDLHKLDKVDIDAEKQIAVVGGGCLLGRVDQACEPFKLGCTFGHDPSTGVGGLVLNGGHGFLERQFGLSIDNLLSARVVLANGQVVVASDTSNSDLFFAIRGGGGNFGVVTEFTFKLHKLPNEGRFIGGARVFLPYYPAENRAQLIEKWVKTIEATPELTGICIIGNIPIIHIFAYIGDFDKGKECFEKNIWSFGWPVVDETKKWAANGGMSYWKDLQTAIRGPDGTNVARRYYYLRSFTTSEVTPELIAAIVEVHGKNPNGDSGIFIIPTSGLAAKNTNIGCVASRAGNYWVLMQASWGRDVFDPAGLAQQRQACVDWVNFASEKIGPLAKCGGYGTLHTDHFDEVRPEQEKNSFYGSFLPKLQELKKKFDPKNVFCVNHNIKPK